jgi:hypothetical protein
LKFVREIKVGGGLAMIKQLQLAASNEQLAEIYSDVEDVGKFAVAKVLFVSEDYTILANVSPIGMYDGFFLIKTDNIYRLNIETRYIQNIEKLYKTKKQKHIKIDLDNENLILGFLEFAQKNSNVVLLELFESGIVQGFIKSVEEDIVAVANLTDEGEPDGESFFNIEDITRISCDDEEANCLKILYSDITK